MSWRRSIHAWMLAAGMAAAAPVLCAAEPIRLHPENPRYFLWRGKPRVLITAGEHYGAVLNRDFDYARYLDELQRHGFNLTRAFSGTYREVPGSFNITGNTLAPAPGRFVCPWARSETPGAADGGNRFDLTRWDEAYFARVKDFLRQAGERGVMVELVLFCTMYDDRVWDASPMNARNNVNGIGRVGKHEVFSGTDPGLLAAQTALARKLAVELNAFDNLYFEICNEPYERGGLTPEWNDRIVAAIVDAEAQLPNRHLIAQGFPPAKAAIPKINPHVSVLNFHAARPDAVRLNDHLNRVIAFDETGGAERGDRKYRTEGWEFMLAGGGVYDHLDFSFTTERPDGTAVPLPAGTPGGGGPELRRQLRVLKEFIESFEFIRLQPADELVKGHHITPEPPGARAAVKPSVRVLAEAGQAYALYINGGTEARLELELPPGAYTADWVNPRTGGLMKSEPFHHAGGTQTLPSPSYVEDIALRVRRAGAQEAARRFQEFTRDPQWESHRSRLLPQPLPVTRQDFGRRDTPHADGTRGEIGGWIQRSLTPAWFAKVIPTRTLNDRLSASGKFAVTRDDSSSGTLFGWFHESSRGWRTPNSLVFRLDGNGGKYWVFYEYGTRHWFTRGAGCFEGERYQTTPTRPFKADGTAHTWSLAYDPDGAEGNGQMRFVLDDRTYTLALAPGHKADGAEFNRFGVCNVQTTGSGMDVGFWDLKLDGQPLELTSDSGWDARGNRVEFPDRHLRPFHDFGWLASARAGGQPGEIGGLIWRDERPAFYADPVGPLTLENELFASGRIAFNGAGSDSAVYLGWFEAASKTNKTVSDQLAPPTNFLAVLLEGPSDVGHYFRPAYGTARGNVVIQDNGPIIRPDGRVHQWSVHYSPSSGQIQVRLDGETRALAVRPEHRKAGARFDRFGLFNLQVGGHFVDVAIDDVTYTVRGQEGR